MAMVCWGGGIFLWWGSGPSITNVPSNPQLKSKAHKAGWVESCIWPVISVLTRVGIAHIYDNCSHVRRES